MNNSTNMETIMIDEATKVTNRNDAAIKCISSVAVDMLFGQDVVVCSTDGTKWNAETKIIDGKTFKVFTNGHLSVPKEENEESKIIDGKTFKVFANGYSSDPKEEDEESNDETTNENVEVQPKEEDKWMENDLTSKELSNDDDIQNNWLFNDIDSKYFNNHDACSFDFLMSRSVKKNKLFFMTRKVESLIKNILNKLEKSQFYVEFNDVARIVKPLIDNIINMQLMLNVMRNDSFMSNWNENINMQNIIFVLFSKSTDKLIQDLELLEKIMHTVEAFIETIIETNTPTESITNQILDYDEKITKLFKGIQNNKNFNNACICALNKEHNDENFKFFVSVFLTFAIFVMLLIIVYMAAKIYVLQQLMDKN